MESNPTIHPIKKILIANRGEIASRIIRTCRKMGIETATIYSSVDRYGLWVTEADIAFHLEGSTSTETYLCGDKILAICRKYHIDAIHPGT